MGTSLPTSQPKSLPFRRWPLLQGVGGGTPPPPKPPDAILFRSACKGDPGIQTSCAVGQPLGTQAGRGSGVSSGPGLAGAKATLMVQARRGLGNPRSPRPGQGGGREWTPLSRSSTDQTSVGEQRPRGPPRLGGVEGVSGVGQGGVGPGVGVTPGSRSGKDSGEGGWSGPGPG